jgi:hypothetical protein
MENKINNLISKLDVFDDVLLIELLKQKLVKTYIYNPCFTEKEIKSTTHGLKRVLCNMSKNENDSNYSYVKRKSIIKKNSCSGFFDFEKHNEDDDFKTTPCKYSELKIHKSSWNNFSFYDGNMKNEICISCTNRKKKMQNYIDDLDEKNYETIENLMTKETIEIFAAINKIKNKLNQIKK